MDDEKKKDEMRMKMEVNGTDSDIATSRSLSEG